MSRDKSNGILGWLVLIIGLMFLWSLIKGFNQIQQARKRVGEAEETLEEEREKNEELAESLGEVQTPEYIERVTRNELNMQKSGEVVVVLPENNRGGVYEPLREIEGEDPNWKKWWNLIR